MAFIYMPTTLARIQTEIWKETCSMTREQMRDRAGLCEQIAQQVSNFGEGNLRAAGAQMVRNGGAGRTY
jgi:hypothetical protein